MPMIRSFQPIFSALRFLTILPVPESWCGDIDSFKKSANWYPVAGLVLGILAACCDYLLRFVLPVSVASFFTLVFIVALTGALHLDGLADSADAFFSGRDRARMLEIMKDSSSGPMGVISLVLLLLGKYVLLISLPGALRFQALIMMPVCGRCAVAFISARLTYSRVEGGTGAFAQDKNDPSRMTVAWLALIVLSLLLFGLGTGVITIIAVLAVSFLLGRYYLRKIGGYTGDILGATTEIVELVPAILVIMLKHLGGM